MTGPQAQPQVRIVPASSEYLSHAVWVLADAFMTEGFTTRTLDLSTERRQDRFRRAQALMVMRKHVQGQPVLLALEDNVPVGIAILKPPLEALPHIPWHKKVRELLPHLPLLLGLARQIRWRWLLSALRAMHPPEDVVENHYTLEGLAVAPSHQGQGIGRRLLTAAHELVENDSVARGIYLYTADERNRTIYERSGYRLLSSIEAAPAFTVHHMALSFPGSAHDAAIAAAQNPASPDEIRIVSAGSEHLPAAADLLGKAFQDEPYTNWLLDLSTLKSRRRLAAFMALTLTHFYARGDTILVALEDDRVVGIAALEGLGPGRRASRSSHLRAMLARIPDLLGLALRLRRRNLAAAGRAVRRPRRLEEDHLTLEWLAVAPGYQGMGIGQRLLDRLRELARSAPNPKGIYAYTIGDDNRVFYKKCGYRLISRVEADPLFVAYHMVLPEKDGAA